jgi:hypothetical protein
MSIFWVLIIVLLILAFAGAPGIGPLHHSYGWGPSGVVGIIVAVVLVLYLLGKL